MDHARGAANSDVLSWTLISGGRHGYFWTGLDASVADPLSDYICLHLKRGVYVLAAGPGTV